MAASRLVPLRKLPSEEQERFSELQDLAADIFAVRDRRKRPKKLTPQVEAGAWPSPEQATTSLAQELDAKPLRRRTSHGLRAGICSAFQWALPEPAAQLANAAVLAHAPTSVVRDVVAAARRSVGLWAALRRGRLSGRLLFAAPAEAMAAFGGVAADRLVEPEERKIWFRWRSECGELEGKDQDVRPVLLAEPSGQQASANDGSGGAQAGASTVPLGMDSLRPYQAEALEAVAAASPGSCCVVLPCGAGKTKTGAALTCSFLSQHKEGCVAVLCMRREGARQWAEELAGMWGERALVVAGPVEPQLLRAARVVLVTYHRLLSDRRRALKAAGAGTCPSWEDDGIGEGGAVDTAAGGAVAARFMAAPCGLIIADECHMVPAPRVGELLKALLKPRWRLVGLTATLLREGGETGCAPDGEAPWPILGRCVYRQTFAQLAPQYLAPVRCVEVSVPVVGEWRELFEQQPLAAAACLSRGKWEVLEHLLAKHAEDSLLITVERCEQARLIAATFGILPLDGSVPAIQIKEYLRRFRKREILALVATHVLDDSADFPELTVMVQMGGFFASRRQEQQRLGRLLRWGPVKRQRWEASGARPTFYVLVHEGTVEERMSRHRTSSVSGVEYEQICASEVTEPPRSPLRGSSLFDPADTEGIEGAARSRMLPHAAAATAAASDMEARCLELSRRVARSLPGAGKGAATTDLDDIRRWLRGGDLQKRVPKREQGNSSSDEEVASWEDDGAAAQPVAAAGGKAARSTASAPAAGLAQGARKRPRRAPAAAAPGGGGAAACAASASSSSSSGSSSSSSGSSSSSSSGSSSSEEDGERAPQQRPGTGGQKCGARGAKRVGQATASHASALAGAGSGAAGVAPGGAEKGGGGSQPRASPSPATAAIAAAGKAKAASPFAFARRLQEKAPGVQIELD